jgi:hypothetical protein
MSDERDSAPRTRPFTPPLPPFRGPSTAARAPLNPLTPPETKRGALFIGTRAPSKAVAAEPELLDVALLAPEHHESSVIQAASTTSLDEPQRPATVEAEDSRAEAIAATEAMPWLFADPRTADAKHTPPLPLAGIVSSHMPEGDVAAPEEAAQALSGLPYIDQTGEEHQPDPAPVVSRPSGRMHRIDFDVASVLDRIADQVRGGAIDVGPLDATIGDAAVLASVLAALLKQRAS